MKHFNLGNVWGRVAGVKRETSSHKAPYLAITLECPNELFGNVKTYGRLWGEQRIEDFLGHFKAHPGQTYRFRGFFSQYTKRDRVYSNYTFFSWEPVEGKEYRASFVLVGEVTHTSSDGQDGVLCLHVVREGKNGHDDVEEDFEVRTLNTQDVHGLDGDIVEAAGMLRAREPEDIYGRRSGDIKPYAMDVKVRRRAEEEAF